MMKIASITTRPEDRSYTDQRAGAFIRVPLAAATLVEGHGIQGDAKAGGSPSRQLNLLSFDWLQDLAEQGYQAAPGRFDGTDVGMLAKVVLGGEIRVGDAVKLLTKA